MVVSFVSCQLLWNASVGQTDSRMLLWRKSVAGGAEEAEEVDEEVDEVEVEREGAPGGQGAVGQAHVHGGHLLDFLGVPGGEADENQHAKSGYYHPKGAVAPEDVDEAADYQAEEGHVEE